MENQLTFNNDLFGSIRTIVRDDGDIWFVGKDVARALSYGEGRSLANAIARHVEPDDKGVTKIVTPGGRQSMVIINESGLYSMVFGSKRKDAKAFKHWVTAEILPSIRKTGSYAAKKMTDDEIIGQALLLQTARLEEARKQIAIMKPKAEFYDAVANWDNIIDVESAAKLLNVGMGRNQLYQFLREEKILMTNNHPYQKYVTLKYFRLCYKKYEYEKRTVAIPLLGITQAGLDFIRKLINSRYQQLEA